MSEPSLGLRLEQDAVNLFTNRSTDRIIEIKLTAPKRLELSKRAPVNLALVLDRSGSMSGEKLDYAKRAALHVLDLLDAQDKAALVVYDDRVETISPCVALDARNKRILQSAITELMVRGSTNLSGGWLRGCQLVGEVLDPSSLQRCLLLTDGLANVGLTNVPELAHHAGEIFHRGVSTSTFGLGDDYDERLLEAMSNEGGGRYYYIADVQDIPAIFEQELEGLTSVTVRNIHLIVDVPAGITIRVVGDWRHEFVNDQLRIDVPYMTREQEIYLYLEVHCTLHGADTHVPLQILATGDGEKGIRLDSQAEIQFTFASDEVVQAQELNKVMLRRFKKVEAAIQAEKALKLEKAGRKAEGSHLLLDYLKEAAPLMDSTDLAEHRFTANKIQSGMNEMDRKHSHMRNYNIRQSRQEQVDELLRNKKDPKKPDPTKP